MIRDYQFQRNTFANEVLLTDRNNFELLPDLLVRIDSSVNQSPITVAIEIEKTVKAKRRIQEKLKKYADGTTLDGVIYVCERPEIQEAVALAYQSSVTGKSRRIGQYDNFFILFAEEGNKPFADDIKLSTTNNFSVSLSRWITEMTSTLLPHRRNNFFELRAFNCSQN